jgi:hypothetical protein
VILGESGLVVRVRTVVNTLTVFIENDVNYVFSYLSLPVSPTINANPLQLTY